MHELAAPDLVRRASPLRGLWHKMEAASVAKPSGVQLREVPCVAQVNLRGDAGDGAFPAAVRRTLGLDLPTVPNTVTSAVAVSALWLGPDEWLVVGQPGAEEGITARLHEALVGLHSSVVDVTANRAVLEISGGRSRHLLMKGCSIDLHPRVFSPGRCAQTNFSRTIVILQQTDATPTWRLFVRSSFAVYLATWLIDAMADYAQDPICDMTDARFEP
jgi:sarcosine oxidase subunit gamma